MGLILMGKLFDLTHYFPELLADKERGISNMGLGLLYRIGAKPIARILVKTPVSANFVTYSAFFMAVVSAYFFSRGSYLSNLIGIAIFQIVLLLDFVDGEIARAKETVSFYGDWVDSILDRLKDVVVIAGIAMGLSKTGEPLSIWILAFVLICAKLMTSSLNLITNLYVPSGEGILKADMKERGLLKHLIPNMINFYFAMTIFVVLGLLPIFFEIAVGYCSLFFLGSFMYFNVRFLKAGYPKKRQKTR